jgi:GH15 family glucan-1,4-alpha-glucosidase
MTDDQIITLDRNTLDAGNVRYLYFGLLDTKDDRSACTIDIEMIRDRYARRDYGVYDMTYDEFNAEWGS